MVFGLTNSAAAALDRRERRVDQLDRPSGSPRELPGPGSAEKPARAVAAVDRELSRPLERERCCRVPGPLARVLRRRVQLGRHFSVGPNAPLRDATHAAPPHDPRCCRRALLPARGPFGGGRAVVHARPHGGGRKSRLTPSTPIAAATSNAVRAASEASRSSSATVSARRPDVSNSPGRSANRSRRARRRAAAPQTGALRRTPCQADARRRHDQTVEPGSLHRPSDQHRPIVWAGAGTR
jgi:hypothetical protein